MDPPPTTSPVQEQTTICLQTFESLLSASNLAEDDRVIAVDADARFRLWVSNVGADHPLHDPRSADARLEDAPEIANRLGEVLYEVQQVLLEVYDIAIGARPDASIVQDHEQLNDIETTSEATTELHELLLSIFDSLNSLFRILILIRKATYRDWYGIAARATYPSFLEIDDVRLVGDIFPKILETRREWLQKRLGRAMTQRCRFLSYSREQADRSSRASESIPSAPPLALPRQRGGAAERPSVVLSKPALASAEASTADAQRVAAFDLVNYMQPDRNDARSQATSFAPIRHVDLNGRGTLEIPELEEFCLDGRPLECPYCRGVFQAKTQQEWKKHVFCDLRAYVCTFKNCDSGPFEDEESWFDHEVEAHRRLWICPICPRCHYSNPDGLRTHLQHSHDTPTHDLDLILRASTSPTVEVPNTSCMFCAGWTNELRIKAAKEGVSLPMSFPVSIEKLRKHLAHHMEQLALFAIDPTFERDFQSAASISEGLQTSKGQGPATWRNRIHAGSDKDQGGPVASTPSAPEVRLVPLSPTNLTKSTERFELNYRFAESQGKFNTMRSRSPAPKPSRSVPLLTVTMDYVPTLNDLCKRDDPDTTATWRGSALNRLGDIVCFTRADISTLAVDAIVIPTTPDLTGGPQSVYERAGPQLTQECKSVEGCEIGHVKMTDAYELPCKKIVHVVGTYYELTATGRTVRNLFSCYRRSLDLAKDSGCTSVAFITIGTGQQENTFEAAAEIAVRSVKSWLSARARRETEAFDRVVFCAYSEQDELVFKRALTRCFSPGAVGEGLSPRSAFDSQEEKSLHRIELAPIYELPDSDVSDLTHWPDEDHNVRVFISGKQYAIYQCSSTKLGMGETESGLSDREVFSSVQLARQGSERSQISRTLRELPSDEVKLAIRRQQEQLIGKLKDRPGGTRQSSWVLAHVGYTWLVSRTRKMLAVFELVEGQSAAPSIEGDLTRC